MTLNDVDYECRVSYLNTTFKSEGRLIASLFQVNGGTKQYFYHARLSGVLFSKLNGKNGIAVGSNGIGVAPNAKWIACMGFPNGVGKSSDVISCAHWIFSPRNEDGESSMAPDVVCCAWTSEAFKPDLDLDSELELKQSIESWLTADIIPVFAMGNNGFRDGTILFPASMEHVISVGSVDMEDLIAENSNRGLITTELTKPNFVAPGENIYCAEDRDEGEPYSHGSGTSMATAHVAGAICVLLDKNMELDGDEIKEILTKTTYKRVDIDEWPNKDYGYGRINVFKALQHVIKQYT